MKRKFACILYFLCILFLFGLAGYGNDGNVRKGILKRIRIRQNVETKNDIAKPANFSLTAYPHKKVQTKVNLGLFFNVCDKADRSLELFFDWQKNTDPESIQNSLKFGLSSTFIFVRTNNNDFCLAVFPKLNYKHDQVAKTESAQFSAFLIPVSATGKFPWTNSREGKKSRLTGFLWFPSLGIEYENIFHGKTTDSEGYRLLGCVKTDFNIFPNTPFDHFVLSGGMALRWKLSSSISPIASFYKYFSFGIDWYPVNNNSFDQLKQLCFAIGLHYQFGEDPDKNFKKQNMADLGLKIFLK
jgi:hypothetical protein